MKSRFNNMILLPPCHIVKSRFHCNHISLTSYSFLQPNKINICLSIVSVKLQVVFLLP